MLEIVQKLLAFSGKRANELKKAFLWGILYSFFEVLPVAAIVVALEGLLLPAAEVGAKQIWLPCLIMALSIVGKIAAGKRSLDLRMAAGYEMCADKRLEAGEILKRVPMGYFNESRRGEIAALLTTSLGEIESLAVPIVDKMANGFVGAFVVCAVVTVYDWRVGLVTLAGLALSTFIYEAMQKRSVRLTPRRQAAQFRLVAAVLEYIQGLAVVKAFGLGERSQRALDLALTDSCESNIALERSFSFLICLYQLVFKSAAATVIVVACLQYFNGGIALAKCLALISASFMLYSHIEIMGSVYAVARAITQSLDRFELIGKAPIMDEGGKDVQPRKFDIRMENVSFGYGDKDVLHSISMHCPQGSTTAIVGPSGSGKTTLCNLIARFWDAREGSVLFGGTDVRQYTCEALLGNISMVFQNVYLFEDSILNNIRFGKPGADMSEVAQAAEKAACHEFITNFPQGYDTPAGEGGCRLSGGERQRISLARAILKNAPVVILDEATASLDPENERKIQAAFAELMRDKTVIMIAHRLSTVRNADQILVLDEGRIVQRGKHAELLAQDGLYKAFVSLRERAENWSLQ